MNLLFLSETATRPPVDLYDLWGLIFTLCNLLILYLVFKKFFFAKVNAIIDKRKTEIDETYDRANEAEAQAQAKLEEYDARIAEAQSQAEEIVGNAVRTARTKESEILQEARAKAAETIAHAESTIEIDKQRAINEVKEGISDMAVAIASKVIEKDITPEDHRRLIDEFIDGISDGEGAAT